MPKTMKNQMLPKRGEGCRCKGKTPKTFMYVCMKKYKWKNNEKTKCSLRRERDAVAKARPQTGCNFSFQCNKLKKSSFSNKKEIGSYSSFNRASFVTFVTAKVTIWQMHVK